MIALEIIKNAMADGVLIELSSGGDLDVTGENSMLDAWVPKLKQHKAEIIHLLEGKPVGETTRTLPAFCRAGCYGLEQHGGAWCCANPFTGTWKRLDLLKGCPGVDRFNEQAKHINYYIENGVVRRR